MKFTLTALALSGIMALTPLTASAAENTTSNSTHYEFKVLSFGKFVPAEEIEGTLNELGDDGWKLEGLNQVLFNGSHSELRFYLSRPREKQ